ncbi:DUF3830 family protein [Synergistaceae bacterium OttesenSCG-928-D05]|nr:DUF3830 family protein [Synergistaceae bacterium OttesenSCG-928-D05]
MKKMLITFPEGDSLKIKLFEDKAPETVKALAEALPQEVKFMHARFNGETIFVVANIDKDLPQENHKAGSDMKAGEISMWLGSPGFKDKAIHFWYGPKVAGPNHENVFGEFDGDLAVLNAFGISIWTEGPRRGTASIVEE